MKNWLSITALCLILAACGPKLIYPNLSWLIPVYLDDYISLDDGQSERLKSSLSRQLKWHCRVQLPLYVDLLEDMKRDFERSSRPIPPARLMAYVSRLEEFWMELRVQLGPDIADILASATDRQIQELYDTLDKKNRKREKKYLGIPEDAARRLREKRMVKRLKYWLPELTREQEQAVAEWSAGLDPIAEEWLDDRKRVQNEFRRLLDQRTTNDRFQSDFTDLLLTFDRTRSPDYQARFDANTARTLAFLSRLNQMLTPDQRAHLLDRIEKLSRAFKHLACEQNG